MMQKISLSIFLLLLILGQGLYAQSLKSEITIANEKVVGSDYYFDLYLKTSAATSGELYLADSDIRLSFDHTLFSNPSFQKRDSTISLGNAPFTLNLNIGYCTLVPTDDTPSNTLMTQASYHSAMSLSMPIADILSIEIAGPKPSDQTALTEGVAKIDGSPATHRLGRFYLSGYMGSGNPNLSLALDGLLDTQVFSYAAAQNFATKAVEIEAASLPVEWLSFSALKIDANTVELNWVTGSEINNDRFIIEKRLEEGEFTAIQELKGAGFSEVATHYQYEDRSPMAAVVYYRLQQIDFDGTADFSDIVELHFDQFGVAKYSVYPNPAKDHVNLEILSEKDQIHQYKVMDLRGKTVIKGSIEENVGQTQISVQSLAAGTYLLQIKNTKGHATTLKLSVE